MFDVYGGEGVVMEMGRSADSGVRAIYNHRTRVGLGLLSLVMVVLLLAGCGPSDRTEAAPSLFDARMILQVPLALLTGWSIGGHFIFLSLCRSRHSRSAAILSAGFIVAAMIGLGILAEVLS